jgi:hypothetical protein
MNVRFCSSCRSLILSDFRYCPYCGAAVSRGPTLAEALTAPFERIGADAGPEPVNRCQAMAESSIFAKAEASLDRLEADMDLILQELEKQGRPSS